MTGVGRLLALALVLAVVRHLLFWDPLVAAPAAVLAQVAQQPVVREWSRAAALRQFEQGHYQPVDLRRQQGIPFIGGQLAWQLPMPLSMTILDRYRKRATARRLIFLMTAAERAEGERMLRDICRSLGVRDAGLSIWEDR